MDQTIGLLEKLEPYNAAVFVVAVVAVLVAIYNWRIADLAARNHLLSDVREWGNDVIDALSDAQAMCVLDVRRLPNGEAFLRRSSLMSRLSALIDPGRLYFPNAYPADSKKAGAFRGLRPPILDLVTLAHSPARSIDYDTGASNDQRRLAFVAIKREFVSVVQTPTAFSAPRKVEKYEKHLASLAAAPLPTEVQHLAAMASDRSLGLKFDNRNLE